MNIKNEIPLTVSFELGSTEKTIRDLLNISKGTTYKLEYSKVDLVTIKVEREEIGEGEIFIRGGKMFVKIIKLGREEEEKNA